MRFVVSTLVADLGSAFASLAGVVERGCDRFSPMFANVLHDMSTELALGVAAFVAVMVIFVVMRARGPGGVAKSTSSTTAQPFFPPPPKNPPLRPDQIVLRLDRQKNREPGSALQLPRRPAEVSASPGSGTGTGPDIAPGARGNAPLGAALGGASTASPFATVKTAPLPERGSAIQVGALPAPLAPHAEARDPIVMAFPELSVELLRHLEWKRFEVLVHRYYEASGLQVTRTPVAEGVGVDLQIRRGDEPQPFRLVHCHAGEPSPVQLEAVTALASNTVAAAAEVVFVTSGNFSPGAQAFAQTKRITLITGDIMVARFNALLPNQRGEILDEVLAGDYTTPTCRRCDLKLVMPPATEGQARTWSCPRAPHCTFVLPARVS